jgi:L-glyceraldehyde 3-phosphate reductase
MSRDMVNDATVGRIRALTEIADARGQSLAQLALSWVLRRQTVTSALVGASSVKQLETNIAAIDNLVFTDEEVTAIDEHAVDLGINLWEPSSAV